MTPTQELARTDQRKGVTHGPDGLAVYAPGSGEAVVPVYVGWQLAEGFATLPLNLTPEEAERIGAALMSAAEAARGSQGGADV